MLVIDKPAGFPSIAGRRAAWRWRTISRAALRPAARSRSGAPAGPRHLRLPGARPPPQGAGRLGDLFKHGKIDKTYWAVVEGGPEAEAGRIDLPLGRRDETRGWWMKVDPDGLPSVTIWSVLGRGPGNRPGWRWSRSPGAPTSSGCIAPRGLADRRRPHLRHRAARGGPPLHLHAREIVGAALQEQAAGHRHGARAGAHARSCSAACGWRSGTQAASSCRPVMARRSSRSTTTRPARPAPASRTGVNCSVRPMPPRSVSTRRRAPTSPSR